MKTPHTNGQNSKSKIQNPNKSQSPKSNTAPPSRAMAGFGIWNLEFIWVLVFGFWNLFP
jgi:hypothetical protein